MSLKTNKVTTITLDGNEANITNRVGSNVYAFEIICQLEKLTRHTNLSCVVLLSSEPIVELPKARKGWKYQIIGPRPFWTQLALPFFLLKHRSKIKLHYTPGHYAPAYCPVPYVSSVMDLAFLETPEYFKTTDRIKLTRWTKVAVKNASKVIAISHFSRSEIVKRYLKSPKDIIVTYPAVTKKLRVPAKTKQDFFKRNQIKTPYFLYVGTLQPRKNVITLIAGFEKFQTLLASRSLASKRTKKKLPQLVLAGKIGWLADETLQAIAHSSQSKHIKQLGYVTEEEKQLLYQQATASILIGLYEGFGIPPLESLQFGTLPIVSNSTSLPEVVGDAGLLVDPNSSKQVAEALWQAYSLTFRQRADWRKKGKKQLQKFSWQKSAQTVLNTLQELTKVE